MHRRLLFLRIEAEPHVEGAATRRSTVKNIAYSYRGEGHTIDAAAPRKQFPLLSQPIQFAGGENVEDATKD